jgi:hypothetical protein
MRPLQNLLFLVTSLAVFGCGESASTSSSNSLKSRQIPKTVQRVADILTTADKVESFGDAIHGLIYHVRPVNSVSKAIKYLARKMKLENTYFSADQFDTTHPSGLNKSDRRFLKNFVIEVREAALHNKLGAPSLISSVERMDLVIAPSRPGEGYPKLLGVFLREIQHEEDEAPETFTTFRAVYPFLKPAEIFY